MPHRSRRPALLALVLFLVLAATAHAARAPRKITLKFPRFTVPASTNVEACVFIRLPLTTAVDLSGFTVRHVGARKGVTLSHFLVYLYQGERLGEFATQQKQVIESLGCLGLGPVDRDARQLIASGAAANSRGLLPPGIALALVPVPATPGGPPDGVGLLMDANWINDSTKPRRVSSKLVLQPAKAGTVKRRLVSILSHAADAGIAVPPLSEKSTTDLVDARWRPPVDACLYDVTDHMHQRGLFFGVDRLDANDVSQNPEPGFPSRFEPGRTYLFSAPDFTDPGSRTFRDGLLVRTDESLRFGCRHENGESLPVRLGCEEEAGMPPGSVAGGPAKPCKLASDCPAADAAYPGRSFTGACVPATLVAGTDAEEDEACTLAGFYWEAQSGVAPETACDVSGLPPIN